MRGWEKAIHNKSTQEWLKLSSGDQVWREDKLKCEDVCQEAAAAAVMDIKQLHASCVEEFRVSEGVWGHVERVQGADTDLTITTCYCSWGKQEVTWVVIIWPLVWTCVNGLIESNIFWRKQNMNTENISTKQTHWHTPKKTLFSTTTKNYIINKTSLIFLLCKPPKQLSHLLRFLFICSCHSCCHVIYCSFILCVMSWCLKALIFP